VKRPRAAPTAQREVVKSTREPTPNPEAEAEPEPPPRLPIDPNKDMTACCQKIRELAGNAGSSQAQALNLAADNCEQRGAMGMSIVRTMLASARTALPEECN
jgi:hypothetical protein